MSIGLLISLFFLIRMVIISMKRIYKNIILYSADSLKRFKIKIKGKTRGSLSIEAAIVLPIFLFALFAASFLIKIIYIEEKIEAAMTEVARQMSTGAYAITYLGVLDEIEGFLCDVIDIDYQSKDNALKEWDLIAGLVEFQINNDTDNKREEGLGIKDKKKQTNANTAFSEKIIQLSDEKNQQKGLISQKTIQSANALLEIIDFIKQTTEDSEGLIFQVGKDKAMQLVKDYAGASIARAMMNNSIKEEEFEQWGIVNGKKGINYSKSEFIVKDDIKLVAIYEIEIPLMNKVLKPFFVKQEVKVRAYTGDGNFKARLNRSGEKEEEENIVYITRTGIKYHNSKSCRYIDVKILPVKYQEVKNKKAICEVCAREKRTLDHNTIVFSTQDSDIFHVSNQCRTIYRDIMSIELEEALEKGYTPCSKCGR